MREPTAGTRAEITREVTDGLSADAYGNEGVHVLATPALAMLFEQAAIEALGSFLDAGEFSVGAELRLRHTAPTAVGMHVTVAATVTAANGRLVELAVEASDDAGPIGEGTHVRAVLERERFDRGVEKRRSGG